MYNYSGDIDALQETLLGLYAELAGTVADGVASDSDDVRARDAAYDTLRTRFSMLDEESMKAIPQILPEASAEYGEKGKRKGLPFLTVFGAVVLSFRIETYRSVMAVTHEELRKDTNGRFADFRRKSKGAKTMEELRKMARSEAASISDKKEAKAGRFSIWIHPDFDARQEKVVRKAAEFLTGKDFKIRSQETVGNLKARLQETLAVGYAKGESGKDMAARVRRVLGDTSNAETIAVTEIGSAANHAEYEYARDYRSRYQIDVIKTWRQIPRRNRRKTHASVSGMSLRFSEQFIVDGEAMDGPHSDGASARNVVNCACYLDLETGKSIAEEE